MKAYGINNKKAEIWELKGEQSAVKSRARQKSKKEIEESCLEAKKEIEENYIEDIINEY